MARDGEIEPQTGDTKPAPKVAQRPRSGRAIFSNKINMLKIVRAGGPLQILVCNGVCNGVAVFSARNVANGSPAFAIFR